MSRARVVPDMAMPAPLALAPRVRSESLRRPARKRDEYAARIKAMFGDSAGQTIDAAATKKRKSRR